MKFIKVDILDVNDENNIKIYIEPWFDVDKRLNTNVAGRDDVCVNLYTAYNYQTEMLEDMIVMIDGFEIYHVMDFNPTEEEKELIITAIKKQLLGEYKCTVDEYVSQKNDENMMLMFGSYIIENFSAVFESSFVCEMLDNIIYESMKIKNMSERCEWLFKMIPQISLSEIRDILLR